MADTAATGFPSDHTVAMDASAIIRVRRASSTQPCRSAMGHGRACCRLMRANAVGLVRRPLLRVRRRPPGADLRPFARILRAGFDPKFAWAILVFDPAANLHAAARRRAGSLQS